MRQLFAKEYLEDFCFMYRDISPIDEVCSLGCRPVPVSDNKIILYRKEWGSFVAF